MAARSRTISLGRMSGKAAFNWEGPYDPTFTFVPVGNATCIDVTGHGGDCEPFTVNRLVDEGGFLNRTYGGSSTDNWFNQYICQWMRTTGNGQHLAVSGVPSDATRSTNAVQRTNPSRPYVDVPVSLLDIRLGLQNIHEAGHNLIKSLARRNLNYQFMIRPLVGDIVKLMNAQDQINRRIRDINKLYEGKGLRRTVKHGSWSSTSFDSNVLVQSTYDTINVRMRTTTTVTCKTHVRWAPQNRCGVKPSPRAIRAQAVQAVLGGTIDFSTLWELIPWSWLVDWFSNVGEYISTTRNIIPARLVGVYPMKHTQTECEWLPVSEVIRGRKTTIGYGKRTRETKTRSIGSVALSAHFPFLDGRQLGILASLAATRR